MANRDTRAGSRNHRAQFRSSVLPFRSFNPATYNPAMDESESQSSSFSHPPIRTGRTIREVSKEIDDLRKENFELKLRIYLTEQRVEDICGQNPAKAVKMNVQMQIELENTRKDLKFNERVLEKSLKTTQKSEEDLRKAETKIVELEERIHSMFQELQSREERFVSPIGSESEATGGLFTPNVTNMMSSGSEGSFKRMRGKLESELEMLKDSLATKDDELKSTYERILELEREIAVLRVKDKKKSKSIQSLCHKLKKPDPHPEGQEMWSLFENGMDAAKENDREQVVSTVNDIKARFSQMLSLPLEEVFPAAPQPAVVQATFVNVPRETTFEIHSKDLRQSFSFPECEIREHFDTLNRLQLLLDDKTSAFESLKKQYDDLEKEQNVTNSNFIPDNTKVLIEKLQREIQDKTNDVELLTVTCNDLTQEVERLKSDLCEAMKRLTETETNLSIEGLKDGLIPTSLSASSSSHNLTNYGASDNAECLKEEVLILVLKLQDAKKDVTSLKSKNSEMQSHLHDALVQKENASNQAHILLNHMEKLAEFLEQLLNDESFVSNADSGAEVLSQVTMYLDATVRLSQTISQNISSYDLDQSVSLGDLISDREAGHSLDERRLPSTFSKATDEEHDKEGSQNRKSLVDKKLSVVESGENKIVAVQNTLEAIASQLSGLTVESFHGNANNEEKVSSDIQSLKSTMAIAMDVLLSIKESVQDSTTTTQDVGVIQELKENMLKILKAVQTDEDSEGVSPNQAKYIAKKALSELDTFKQQLLSITSSLLSKESIEFLNLPTQTNEQLTESLANLELLLEKEKLKNAKLLIDIADLSNENKDVRQQLDELQGILTAEKNNHLMTKTETEKEIKHLTDKAFSYEQQLTEAKMETEIEIKRLADEIITYQEQLCGTNSEIEKEIKYLSDKAFGYEQQLSEAKMEAEKEIKRLADEIVNYQQQLCGTKSEAEKEIIRLADEVEGLLAEKESLNQKILEEVFEKESVKQQLEKLTKNRIIANQLDSELQVQLNSVEATCDHLKNSLKVSEDKLTAMESKCKAYENDISKAFLEKTLVQSEKLSMTKTINNQKAQIEESEHCLQNMQDECDKLKRISEDTENKLKDLESKCKTLERELAETVKEKEQQTELLNETLQAQVIKVAEMERQHVEYETEKHSLQSTIDKLHDELTNLRKNLNDMNLEMKSRSQIRQTIRELSDTVEEKEQKTELLDETLQAQLNKVAEMERQHAEYETEEHSLQSTIDELHNEVNELQNNLNDMNLEMKNRSQVRQTIRELLEMVEEKEQKLELLNETLQAQLNKVTEMERQHADYETEKQSLQSTIDKLHYEVNDLRKNLNDMNLKMKSRSQIRQTIRELSETVEEKEDKTELLNETLQAQLSKVAEMERQHAEYETEKHSLQSTIDKLHDEVNDLWKNLNDMNLEMKRRSQIRQTIKELSETVEEKEQKTELLNETLQAQLSKVSEMERRHAEYETEKRSLQGIMDKLHDEVDDLQKNLNDMDLEMKSSQPDDLKKEIYEKDILIAEQTTTINSLTSDIGVLEDKDITSSRLIHSLEQENGELAKQVANLGRDADLVMPHLIQSFERQVGDSKVEIQHLSEELETKNSMIEHQKDMILRLQNDVQTLEERKVVSKSLHESLNQENVDFVKELETTLTKADSMEKQCVVLLQKLENKDKIIQDQSDKVTSLKDRIITLEHRIASVEKLNYSLDQERSNLTRKYSLSMNQKQATEQELNTLTEQIAILEHQLSQNSATTDTMESMPLRKGEKLQLITQLAVLQKTISKLEHEKDDLAGHIATLELSEKTAVDASNDTREQIKIVNGQKFKLVTELLSLKNTVSKLNVEKNALVERTAALECELGEKAAICTSDDPQEQIRIMNCEKLQLATEIASLNNTVSKLKQENNTLTKRMATLECELSVKAAICTCADTIERTNVVKGDKPRLISKIAKLTKTVSKLNQEKTALAERTPILECEVGEKAAIHSSYDTLEQIGIVNSEELQIQIASLKNTISKLKHEKIALTECMTTLECELTVKAAICTSADTMEQMNVVKGDKLQLIIQIAELTKTISKLNHEKNDLTEHMATLKCELHEKAAIHSSYDTLEQVRIVNSEKLQLVTQIALLKNTVSKLNQEKTTLADHAANLEFELSEKSAIHMSDDTLEQVDGMKGGKLKLISQIASLKNTVSKLNQEKIVLAEHIETLEISEKTTLDSFDEIREQMTIMNGEKLQLVAQLASMKNIVSKLNEEKIALAKLVTTLEFELSEKTAIHMSDDSLEQVDGVKGDKLQLVAQIVSLKNTVSKLNQDKIALVEHTTSLECELSVKSAICTCDDTIKQTNVVKEDKLQLVIKNSELTKTISKLRQEANAFRQYIAAIEQELSEKNKTGNLLEKEAENLKGETGLKAEIEILKNTIFNLRQEYEVTNSELTSRLSKMRSDLERKESECHRLKTEKEMLHEMIDRMVTSTPITSRSQSLSSYDDANISNLNKGGSCGHITGLPEKIAALEIELEKARLLQNETDATCSGLREELNNQTEISSLHKEQNELLSANNLKLQKALENQIATKTEKPLTPAEDLDFLLSSSASDVKSKTSLKQYQEQISDLNTQNQSLQKEVSEFRKKVKIHDEFITSTKQQISKLLQDLELKTAENKKLNDELQQVRNTNEILWEKVSKEKVVLQKGLESFISSSCEPSQKFSLMSQVKQFIEKLEKEIATASDSYDNMNNLKMHKLASDLENDKNAHAYETISKLEHKLESQIGLLNAEKGKNNDLSQKVAFLKQELEKQNAVIERMETDHLLQFSSQQVGLQKKSQESSKSILQLQRELSQKSASLSELEAETEHETVCSSCEYMKTSLQQYQEQVNDLNSQNTVLCRTVSGLERQLKNHMDLLGSEQEKNKDLCIQISDAKLYITEKEQVVISLKEQLEGLLYEKEKDGSDYEVESLQSIKSVEELEEGAANKSVVSWLTHLLEHRENELAHRENELATARDYEQNIAKQYQEQINDLNTQNLILRGKVSEVQQKLDSLENIKDLLNSEVEKKEQLFNQIENLNAELKNKEQQLKESEKLTTDLRDKLSGKEKLSKELATVQSSLDHEENAIKQYQEQIDDLNIQKQTMRKTVSELQQKIESLENVKKGLLNSEVEKEQQLFNQIEALNAELKNKEQQLKESEKLTTDLRDKLSGKEKLSRELATVHSSLDHEEIATKRYQEQVDDLNIQKQTLRQTVSELQKKIESLENVKKSLLNSEVEKEQQLFNQIEALNAELKHKEQQLKESEKLTTDLREKLSEKQKLSKELATVHSSLDHEEHTTEQYQEQVDDLNTQNLTLRRTVSEVKTRLKSLENIKDLLSSEVQKTDLLSSQLRSLNAELMDSEHKLKESETQITELKDQLFEKQMSTIEMKHRSSGSLSQFQSSERLKLLSELKQFEEELATVRNSLDNERMISKQYQEQANTEQSLLQRNLSKHKKMLKDQVSLLDAATEKNQELSSQHLILSAELKAKEQKEKEQMEEIIKLKDRMTQIHFQKKVSEHNIKPHKSKSSSLSADLSEVSDMKVLLEEREKELASAKSFLDYEKNTSKQYEERIRDLVSENSSLHETVSKLEIKIELDDKNTAKQISDLSDENSSLRETVSLLKKDLQSQGDSLDIERDKNTKFLSEIEILRQNLADQNVEIETLRQNINSEVKVRETEKENNEKSKLGSELQEGNLEMENASLKKHITSLENSVKRHLSLLKTQKENNSYLRSQLVDLEELKIEEEETVERLESVSKEKDTLEMQLQDLETKLKKLQTQSSKDNVEIHDLKEKLEATIGPLDEKTKTCADLEKQLRETKRQLMVATDTFSETNKKLSKELFTKDAAIEKLQARKSSSEGQILDKVTQSADINRLKGEIDELESELSRVKKHARTKDKQCKSLEKLNEELQVKLAQLERKKSSIRLKTLDKKSSQEQALSSSSGIFQNESTQTLSLAISEGTVKDHERKIHSKDQQIEELEMQNSELKAKLSASKKIYAESPSRRQSSKSVSCHLLSTFPSIRSIGQQTSDITCYHPSGKQSSLSQSISAESQDHQRDSEFKKLTTHLANNLKLSAESIAELIAHASRSGDLVVKDSVSHELFQAGIIDELRRENESLISKLKNSEQAQTLLQNQIKQLSSADVLEKKTRKSFESAIQIMEQSNSNSLILKEEDMQNSNVVTYLEQEKWLLLQRVLKYERVLSQPHPASMKKQLLFMDRLAEMFSQMNALTPVRPQSDSVLYGPASSNRTVHSRQRQILSLQMDIEFLTNTKVLLKNAIIPALRYATQDEGVAKKVSNITEKASRLFKVEQWGSIEKVRDASGHDYDATPAGFEQLGKEIRPVSSNLCKENTFLKTENETLREEIKTYKKMPLIPLPSNVIKSDSELRLSLEELRKVFSVQGQSLIESYEKHLTINQESAERELHSSKSSSRGSESSIIDHKVSEAIGFEQFSENVRKTMEWSHGDVRSHYSSPDLGIESDPNQEHFPLSQAGVPCPKKPFLDQQDTDWEHKNRCNLWIYGKFKDLELLKREIEECLVTMKSIDSRAHSGLEVLNRGGVPKKSFECSTLKGILDCCQHAELCLMRSQQVLKKFGDVQYQGSETPGRVILEQENLKLENMLRTFMNAKMEQREQMRRATSELHDLKTKQNEQKAGVSTQLNKTKKILKKTRHNLNINPKT